MASLEGLKPHYDLIPSEEEDLCSSPDLRAARIWRRRFHILLMVFIAVILLMIGSFVYVSRTGGFPALPGNVRIPYTPAPVRYVNKNLTSDFDSSKFTGDPRPELDQAWHDLLSVTGIRLSEAELILTNATSAVRHKEGGYVGGLGVSHSLHCIKRIKQYLYPEYYYKQEQHWDELRTHIDHCLESLRTELLCKADSSVYTFIWTPQSRIKPGVQITQQAACVDWDNLHEWMKSRAAGIDDMIGPAASLYGEETSYPAE
ncbi:hypothetical protein F5Y13DRAFT_204207 [Hypoxylon sp. FL1857]|nr:hypothetical protein F5Y13DRAFT_204207 [Hypoxylon sp. FL1857]